jgi:very-short-patch-repair endonuclease
MREREKRARPLAKRLRRRMTHAEVILWTYLREKNAAGLRFRRQHPIGPYVADFACISARLVIEVDGATHGTPAEIAHDKKRDAYLTQRNWRVLRVLNGEVYETWPVFSKPYPQRSPLRRLRRHLPRKRGRMILR